ncbi:MAG: universal stress protein [Dehalococcoidales bacterium]|nr:universal stress protein [Dehalococcoidales bacterium]MDZ4230464.1 universal stress protein [Dehalococcoidales bacterium]
MEFRKILVPVVGTEVDDETIKLACQLARKNKGKIWAVYVITVKRTLPVDAEIEPEIRKAEEILDHAEVIAEEQDYKLETDLLQAREVGPTIIDEAVEREADLILMGVEYKKHFGQFSLGDVVPYVLKNAPCRVILYHQKHPELSE